MKKFFSFVLFLFIFSLPCGVSALELKSRVIFKKKPSQSEISGWEKDFFRNYESEFAEKLETSDNEAEVSENDQVQIKSTEKKIIKPKDIKKQNRSEIKNDKTVSENKEPVLTDSESMKSDKTPQQPEKIAEKKKLTMEEIIGKDEPEKIEKNDSDNEVDRNGQIRKMKELLKKRKGKSRIENRRIY